MIRATARDTGQKIRTDVTMEPMHTGPEIVPERRLILAVIESAMFDLEHPDPKLRWSAARWFESEDGETMTFEWCCEHVGYDASAIRRHLLPRLSAIAVERASGALPQRNTPMSRSEAVANRRRWATRDVTKAASLSTRDERMTRIAKSILTLLRRNGRLNRSKIFVVLPHAARTLNAALRRLVEAGKVETNGVGSYWLAGGGGE